jgi:hypothetical protein
MPNAKSSPITPDEITRLLRDAGALEPATPVAANQQLASILNLMMQYPVLEKATKRNPDAMPLNSAIASLRRALRGYIEFWKMAETLPNLPEGLRKKVQNLRELQGFLDVAFPENLNIDRKAKSCWPQVGPDLFEYHSHTPWHERAFYLFAWYENHVERACGISRDSAATRFIKAALGSNSIR